MNQMPTPTPLLSDLVLIGGGHAHVHLLKMFGMSKPLPPNTTTATESSILPLTTIPNLPALLTKNGIQTTLITTDVYTPYSGMLPGMVAGHYGSREIHLDLRKLCRFGNVRFIHASAVGIRYNSEDGDSSGGGWVKCGDGRPDVRFDVLSIDVGSSPSIPKELLLENTQQQPMRTYAAVTPVKPISGFAARWESICHRFRRNISSSGDGHDKHIRKYSAEIPFILLVVGGGAGGIELALSAQFALENIIKKESSSSSHYSKDCIKIILATRSNNLLSQHNPNVRQIFSRILEERNVEVRLGAEAIGVECDTNNGHDATKRTLRLSPNSQQFQSSSSPIQFDECLWCTSAGAAPWLSQNTPFDTTEDGFLKVKDTYELVNHPGVFAAGDCCSMVENPRPKAGVFAVRAGPYIKENLIAYLLKKPLTTHNPQTDFLGLISTGDKYAVASRGCHALEGQFLWTLKDQIDRTWMDGYQNLPDMEAADDNDDEIESSSPESKQFLPPSLTTRGPDAMAAFAAAPMRCGGCGAKVGARTLSRVLDAVHRRRMVRARDTRGDGSAAIADDENRARFAPKEIDHEDAAVVMLPERGGGAMVYTIDFFRSFISDPFVFGKIAAVHALSDCHAMGAKAQTALALAIVPFAAFEAMTESTLIDMLSGASDILDEDNCELSGGHTCEGAELALGFSINGYIENPSLLFKKRGGKVGDKIVLTKAIGTGAVFAADMRAKCSGEFVEEAIENMVTSNGLASKVAMQIQRERLGSGAQDGDNGAIHGCTDVTGFGLAGHLLEMLAANDIESEDSIGANINISAVPFLGGALEASTDAIVSSLHRENYRSRRSVINHEEAAKSYPIKYPLLFDPQTAGGLLFFVSPDVHEEFVDRLLRDGGTNVAAVIGELTSHATNEEVCSAAGNQRLFISSSSAD